MTAAQQIIAALMAGGMDAVEAATVLAQCVRDMSGTNDEARREYERGRKAAWRKNSKIINSKPEANDAGVRVVELPQMSGTVRDNRCDVSSLSSSLLPLETKKARKTASVVEGRARGNRLDKDAPLSDADRAFAISHGVDPEPAWAEFVDFWIGVPGHRGVKLNWPGTWRNRVRELEKRGRHVNRTGNHRTDQATGAAPTRDTAVIAGMGRALERRRESRLSGNPNGLPGRSDAAGGTDADDGTADGDGKPLLQLAFPARANA